LRAVENKIKQIAKESGAALVGIAGRERLEDAPPSGNPEYLMPSARSVISFAIPLNRDILRDYLQKKDWLSHSEDQKKNYQKLYGINDSLVNYLKSMGHDALGVAGNCVFRPEPGATDSTEMTEFIPDFSHRYGAVAAGLGRLGWSGNLLTHEYGATVYLGTVLTSAELRSDPICVQNPCDRCLVCASVCPVEMISRKETVMVTIAGITEKIAKKRPNTCCWIGCSDYHGLSTHMKWSNWSPYRVDVPLPEGKPELDELCIRVQKADPQMRLKTNPYTNHRATTFDPDWHFSAACGNCGNVCWEKREDRKENKRLLNESGVVVLNPDGTREAVHEEILEIQTPYEVKVAVSRQNFEKLKSGDKPEKKDCGFTPKDRAVLSFISKKR
jgi:epoxyqueuosine reductase